MVNSPCIHLGRAMFKTILLPADGTAADDASWQAALAVARQFGGHLECLPLRYGVTELLSMAPVSDMNLPMLAETVVEQLERQASELVVQVKREFDKRCIREQVPLVDAPGAAHAVSAHCHATAVTAGEFVGIARSRDLTVLPVPQDEDDLINSVTQSCLFGSGRPLLMVPAERPVVVGATAVIGWNNSPEAARALGAAMPMICAAKRVLVVGIGDEADESPWALEQVVRGLAWHGLTAERRIVRPAGRLAPEAFFQFARDEGAGFAVMGGYGHSRLREFVLGGFTRHALAEASVPVILMH